MSHQKSLPKFRLLIVLISIFLLFYSGSLLAASGKKKSKKQLKITRQLYVDYYTGYTVYPDELVIKHTTTQEVVYQHSFTAEEKIEYFKDGVADPAYLSSLPLPKGEYICTLNTNNYKSNISRCKVGEKYLRKPYLSELESVTVNVSPLEKPAEYSDQNLQSLRNDDYEVVIGFVVDDDNGFPLKDACVGTADGTVSATSNVRGFFTLRVPLPGHREIGVNDIVFEKDGYQTEEWDHYGLQPGVSMTHVRLAPGKGRKIKDEREHCRWCPKEDRTIIRRPCGAKTSAQPKP